MLVLYAIFIVEAYVIELDSIYMEYFCPSAYENVPP